MVKLIINDKDGNFLYSHPGVDETKLAQLKGVYPLDAGVVLQPNWETTDPIVIQLSNAVSGKITPNVDKRYQDIVNIANSSSPVFAAPPAASGGSTVLVYTHVSPTSKGFDDTKTTWPEYKKGDSFAAVYAKIQANLHLVKSWTVGHDSINERSEWTSGTSMYLHSNAINFRFPGRNVIASPTGTVSFLIEFMA